MKRIILSLIFVLSFSSFAAPTVDSMLGKITGIENDRAYIYKGIPYAKATTGDLRFAPPVKADSFVGEFKADKFCKIPFQSPFMNYPKLNGEGVDSLCLNVYTPKGAKVNDKYPVYMWIYGGAFVGGASSLPLYDGSEFAKDGIVFVSINYRLGAEGFYSSKSTKQLYGTTGNWGLLDMILALNWIKDNIKYFGGDPDNVTIGGESAGAFSVSALVLSPLTKGLFKRAVMESGTILSYPFVSMNQNDNQLIAYGHSEKLNSKFDIKDSMAGLADLRNIPPEILSNYCPLDLGFDNKDGSYLIPNFDGYVIPYEPYESLKNGEFNNVDILLGYNTNEGTMFVPPSVTDKQLDSVITYHHKKNGSNRINKLYSREIYQNPYDRSCEYIGDIAFNLGMKIFADNISKTNKVYMYHFDYAPEYMMRTPYKVGHASEIAYVFNNLQKNATKTQRQVADVFHRRVVNFIKTGNPNTDGNTEEKIIWNTYEENNSSVFRISDRQHMEAFKLKDRLEILESELFK